MSEPQPPTRRKTIAVRVSDDEYDTLIKAAERDHTILASYMRKAALDRAAPPRKASKT